MIQKNKKYTYKISIQYLGFRLHGWAKQTGLKTVHERIDKTLEFVFKHSDFKSMGTSRTDAMVSANESAFVLTTFSELPSNFLDEFNKNLPPDIKALSFEPVSNTYNPLDPHRQKTYLYLFSFGEKPHPFSTSLLANIPEKLDIAAMQQAAKCFEGQHDFWNYATKPSGDTKTKRSIASCEILPNTFYTASFFPKESYALRVTANGFLRNQIRLIMGQLFKVGKGEIGLDIVRESLKKKRDKPFKEIAPGSALILESIQ